MQRFQKPDRPDILVRQPHFRRDWKVSAIRACTPKCNVSARRREAPPSGRKASLDSEPRIENFAKTITDECKASYSQHNEDPWEDGHPPFAADDILAAFSNHESPFRGRELCAQSDEAQACHPEDAVAGIDSRLHAQRG